MDRQTLIFDVSSDEDFGLDNSSSADNFDWVSKFLEDDDDLPFGAISNNYGGNDETEINYEVVNSNGDDDDDDLIVVGEVIAKPRRAKRSFHDAADGGDDDDDCVVLEFDPDKPPEKVAVVAANDDDGKDCGSGDDDEDDLVVVGEKGQVACRDFPHSRHLCANFPFSSTPHESRCDLCHCYVCDSVAPCLYWGSGAVGTDHCNATDKAEYWRLERKSFRQSKNPSLATTEHVASLPQLPLLSHLSARPDALPNVAASCGVLSHFGAANMISQCRSQRATVSVARNGCRPHLVSRQLLRTCNNNTPSTRVVHSTPRMVPSRPVFKRPGYSIRHGVANRFAFNSPNVSVAYLQPQSQQVAEKPHEKSYANPRGSSPQLVSNPTFCHSNSSCISLSTLPLPSQVFGLPSPQTPTSRFQGCGQSAAAISVQQHMYSSVHQPQSLLSPVIPVTTSSALNSLSHNSQPNSSITQNVSGPSIAFIRSDMPTGVSQSSEQPSGITQTYLSPSEPCSGVYTQNIVAQSSCQQPSAESSFVGGVVPMHERPPPVEAQSSLDYGFDNWLQDLEPEIPFFGMDSQPSATAPMDPGMLYFDFETSWKGLTNM